MFEGHIIKNVKPDPRGRIGLGGDIIGDADRFHVFKNEDGDIILRPYVEIPQRELWLLNNKQKMQEIEESYNQSQQGKTSKLDLSSLED